MGSINLDSKPRGSMSKRVIGMLPLGTHDRNNEEMTWWKTRGNAIIPFRLREVAVYGGVLSPALLCVQLRSQN